MAAGAVYFGSQGYQSLLYSGTFHAVDATTCLPRWSHETTVQLKGQPGTIDNSPVVDNGVVYVANVDGRVLGLDALTGSTLWSYALPSYSDRATSSSSPASAAGMLFVGSNQGVFALEPSPPATLFRRVYLPDMSK